MTAHDQDGAPLMHVWGASGPPRHDDGTPVITPRLYEHLSPLERELYSGDGLRFRLASRATWLTGGEPVDGWDPEDFVAYALERASVYPDVSQGAVVTWMHRKVIERRRKAEKLSFGPLHNESGDPVEDPEAEEFVTSVLGDETIEMLNRVLSARKATAIRIFAEQGLTPTEAAGTVGLVRTEFYEALDQLKGCYIG